MAITKVLLKLSEYIRWVQVGPSLRIYIDFEAASKLASKYHTDDLYYFIYIYIYLRDIIMYI